MLNHLRELILGKKVLILGFGREGKSSLRRIQEAGGAASIAIADQNGADPEDPSIPVISGPAYMDTLADYDLVFKSPGVVLPHPPAHYACQITSQMDIFFQVFRERIIGITGTKGKSTTATLLFHILKQAGRDCVLAGNIGVPAFDILEQIGKRTLIVCELSCHQLEYIQSSPHMAALLNIHEEHLDHYGSMENYIRAKQQIYLHQQRGDVLFCGLEVLPARGSCQARIYTISGTGAPSDVRLFGTSVCFGKSCFQIPAEEIRLLGRHNYLDIAFDYGICRTLGLSDAEFEAGLKSYEPLPHRLHFVGEQDGVRYYDDSISTICETTIQALQSVPSVGSVLIGGMDRGIDYRELIEFLSADAVPYIFLMYATGKRILREIKEHYPDFQRPERLLFAETLKEAVSMAKKLTPPGTACVLSPAAASYGVFRNFEERGDVFAQLALDGNNR